MDNPAPSPPSQEELSLIRKRIQQHLSPDLLDPSYRQKWKKQNPTYGFCSVASEAAWFMLGGKEQGWVAVTGRDTQGNTHWWLQHKNETIFDPTSEQYTTMGLTPPYQTGRPGGFMGIRRDPENLWGNHRKPSKRAQKLLIKMGEIPRNINKNPTLNKSMQHDDRLKAN